MPAALVKLSSHEPAPAAELKIGDLAKATGKTQRALRLYEELGLLIPGTRTSGGFRVYDQAAVERVNWIAKLQDLGFTLVQIQELVEATATDTMPREAMGRVRQLFHQKLDDVAAQIARLSQLQRELVQSLAYLEECGGCGKEASHGAATCSGCESHDDQAPSLVNGITHIAASKA